MENSELNRVTDLIWSTLNTKDNQSLSKDEQIELIKPIINEVMKSQKTIGKNKVLNSLKKEIEKMYD